MWNLNVAYAQAVIAREFAKELVVADDDVILNELLLLLLSFVHKNERLHSASLNEIPQNLRVVCSKSGRANDDSDANEMQDIFIAYDTIRRKTNDRNSKTPCKSDYR